MFVTKYENVQECEYFWKAAVSSFIFRQIDNSLKFSPVFYSLPPVWTSLSEIIEPCISMRTRLIVWNRAEAGFDLCPQGYEKGNTVTETVTQVPSQL